MAPPRLHLDADTSMRALHTALVARGHDVTRTPITWMARHASDTEQLLGATAQGRVLFTFNTHDFPVLVQQYPQHGPGARRAAELERVAAHCRAGCPAHRDRGHGLAGAGAMAESVAPDTDVRTVYGHDIPLPLPHASVGLSSQCAARAYRVRKP